MSVLPRPGLDPRTSELKAIHFEITQNMILLLFASLLYLLTSIFR
jgi:hypothetical protein